MKLLLKQRYFSLLDNFDIYDEKGKKAYVIEGQIAIGHSFKIYNAADREVASVRQKLLTFMPRFDFYEGEKHLGFIQKKFSLFTPKFALSFNGWYMEGNIFEWDYRIMDNEGKTVATISKELLNWTDTYSINIRDPENALYVLMIVLTIDAEKCSRSN